MTGPLSAKRVAPTGFETMDPEENDPVPRFSNTGIVVTSAHSPREHRIPEAVSTHFLATMGPTASRYYWNRFCPISRSYQVLQMRLSSIRPPISPVALAMVFRTPCRSKDFSLLRLHPRSTPPCPHYRKRTRSLILPQTSPNCHPSRNIHVRSVALFRVLRSMPSRFRHPRIAFLQG